MPSEEGIQCRGEGSSKLQLEKGPTPHVKRYQHPMISLEGIKIVTNNHCGDYLSRGELSIWCAAGSGACQLGSRSPLPTATISTATNPQVGCCPLLLPSAPIPLLLLQWRGSMPTRHTCCTLTATSTDIFVRRAPSVPSAAGGGWLSVGAGAERGSTSQSTAAAMRSDAPTLTQRVTGMAVMLTAAEPPEDEVGGDSCG